MTQATQIQGKGILLSLLSEAALKHLTMLKEQQGKDLCLRVGVRQGGCSGMSYMMDFEHPSNIGPQDEVFDYDGFKIVSDKKPTPVKPAVVVSLLAFNYFSRVIPFTPASQRRFFFAKTLDKIGNLPYIYCIMEIRACLRTLHFWAR